MIYCSCFIVLIVLKLIKIFLKKKKPTPLIKRYIYAGIDRGIPSQCITCVHCSNMHAIALIKYIWDAVKIKKGDSSYGGMKRGIGPSILEIHFYLAWPRKARTPPGIQPLQATE